MSQFARSAFAPAERAAAETLQRQRDSILRLPELAQTLNALPGLTIILNEQRQIAFANSAFARFIGLGEDVAEMIGQRPGEVFRCIHAIGAPGGCGTASSCRNCGGVLAVLKSLRGTPETQDCCLLRRSRDGSVEAADLRICAHPLRLSGTLFTLVSIQDIGNEKRRQSLERIFFHDILNTATGMHGLAKMLTETELPAHDTRRICQTLLFSGEQLIDEINAHRTLNAAERNDLVVQSKQVDLLPLVEMIGRSYAAHDASRGRIIWVHPESQKVTLTTDPVLLRRVILNLLKNALEASEFGDTVTLRTTISNQAARISIHNPAVIPDEIRMRIFNRSFSTRGPGRGLGTYSAKLLTERYLHGQIEFQSSDPGGTVFSVVLPIL